jgi:hypothetical protein
VPCAEIPSSIVAQAAIAPAGSRWSARSNARTNDLDAAKRQRTICHRGRRLGLTKDSPHVVGLQ